jgi:hypothetical protein
MLVEVEVGKFGWIDELVVEASMV